MKAGFRELLREFRRRAQNAPPNSQGKPTEACCRRQVDMLGKAKKIRLHSRTRRNLRRGWHQRSPSQLQQLARPHGPPTILLRSLMSRRTVLPDRPRPQQRLGPLGPGPPTRAKRSALISTLGWSTAATTAELQAKEDAMRATAAAAMARATDEAMRRMRTASQPDEWWWSRPRLLGPVCPLR